LAFSIAIAVLVVGAVSQLQAGRGIVQRLLDAVIGLVAAGSVIASLVFVGSAVAWLSLAAGLGFVLLGFVGLTLHEIWTYRATHGLTVRTFEAPELARPDGVRSAA
jgi:membrane protein YdbS with pleckstrin-like domain